MATHSSILAWKIPWTEEPDRLQSMRPQRVWLDSIQATQQFNMSDETSYYYYYLLNEWYIHIVQNSKFSSVQSLSRVRLLATPWTAPCQASLSITNSWSSLKFTSVRSMMQSNHLIPCRPLLLLPSIPASGSFQMSQYFASDGQSIGVSASTSVLPMYTQDWSPLGWTGWISLQSKGLSRVFSKTTVQKHQFFGTQLSL